ncbi:MAG: alpha-ribazole phosphatase [Methylovulum sp.]|uniref:alpha-ribazole phosphatase n=1 Tax=Methylovulum sp. TaxID=1916980 RepID=UPI0026023749|nr:alpha-ribazole phosphatase [Methylovulum sp.]MDD2725344.1 alpha-ribazole phosphatase [Methylovulum sp.]MDD5126451.1 alpha-ribazole phosphatase [Methylovulum sp.]
MDVYLIRHTKTVAAPGLCYGQTDIALDDNFADELLKIRQKLPDLPPDCPVFCSPLSRCLQLAGCLSDNVQQDGRLLEINFGDWENTPFDAIDAEALRHWTDNFVHIAPPNGESFTDLYQRAGDFWQDVLRQDAQQVLVVTHAGIIRALLAQVLALPLANAFQFRVALSSVHKLYHTPDYTYIDYLNL